MSLQKTIDFKNGIVAENAYITISNINIDFENKSANFNVEFSKDGILHSLGWECSI